MDNQPQVPPIVPPPVMKASSSFFKRFKIGRFGIFALLIAAIPVIVGAAQFVTDNRQQAAGSGPTISGIIFIDTNGNGAKDAGELPYTQTAQVNLRVQGGNDKKAFTNQNGLYVFDNLKLDINYTVRLDILPTGYTRTTPVKQMQLGQNNRKKTFDVGIISQTAPPPGATETPTPTPGGTTGRTLTCAPSSITLTTQDQTLTATFRNARGETVQGRTILWRSDLPDSQIAISNPSPNTNANGVATTRVRAKTQAAVGKAGTVTAIFDNERTVRCTITLLSGQGGDVTPTLTPTPATGRTLTCSPEELVLKREEQQVTATFRNASGETVRGRKILWRSSLSDNQINILNPSSETDADGIVRTRVRARDQKFVGKTGTITAVFDNDRTVRCTIDLVAVGGGEPTATPTPTGEPPVDPGPLEPGEVRLQLTVFLDGIGKAGDKQNRESTNLGNNNPQEKQKDFIIQLVKDLGRGNYEVMQQATALLTFDATTGNYKGAVDFTDVPQGEVRINYKTKRHVTLLSDKETVTPGEATDALAVYMLAGDANYDGSTADVALDYSILYGCFTGFNPVPRDCDDARKDAADFTDDGVVDVHDFTLFLRDISGQDQSPIE